MSFRPQLRAVDSRQDREPRFDLDAERAVLGGVLLENTSFDMIEAIVTPADFHHPAHAVIFECIQALKLRGEPVDVVTLSAELRGHERLNTVGGAQYLGELTDTIPTIAHIEQHARIVADHAVARRIGAVGREITDAATDPSLSISRLVEISTGRLVAATSRRSDVDPVSLEESIREVYEQIQPVNPGAANTLGPVVVNTGFRDLDDATAGLRAGQLVVIGARPRVGKTALAMQIAANASAKRSVIVFSLEMSRVELVQRLICAEGRVDHGRMRRHRLTAEDAEKIDAAAESVYARPLYIDDKAGLTIAEIRARAKRFARRHQLGLIVVDYLQKVGRPFNAASREEAVAIISNGLKEMAKELRVPVIALAQINRAGRDKPTLEHLRESGAIEADADIVMLLHRDELVNRKSHRQGIADVILAKQRSDASEVSLALKFTGSHVRFDDLEKIEGDSENDDDSAPTYSVGGYQMPVGRG